MRPKPGVLVVTSLREDEVSPSKTAFERSWRGFLKSGSTHSSGAHLLPRIMRRCEREGIPYRLTARPGYGYHIEPLHREAEEHEIF